MDRKQIETKLSRIDNDLQHIITIGDSFTDSTRDYSRHEQYGILQELFELTCRCKSDLMQIIEHERINGPLS